jgi:TRAP-type C4-dicarboxylate transport system permease small subunit
MQAFVTRLSIYMSVIAGIVLVFMAGITFLDVVLRYFKRPIVGTYEIVSFLGVVVVAMALPRASLMGSHVFVDIVVDRIPEAWRKVFRVFTRLLVFLLFAIAIFYFIAQARALMATRTVTMTLKVPFYPVVFALAASCVVQCLVSICEIMGVIRRKP